MPTTSAVRHRVRRGWVWGSIVVVLLALASACSSGDDDAATTTTTSTAAPTTNPTTTVAPATTAVSTTSIAPSTTLASSTTPAPTTTLAPTTDDSVAESVVLNTFGFGGPREVDAGNEPTTGADGSGCAPGGALLPDGVWLVQLTSVTDALPLTVEFDLLCRYTGENIPQEPEEARDFDDWIFNDNPTLRTLPVSAEATFHPGWCHAEPGEEFTEEQRPGLFAADVLPVLGTDADPFSSDFLNWASVWLLVDEGEVVEFVDAFYYCAG